MAGCIIGRSLKSAVSAVAKTNRLKLLTYVTHTLTEFQRALRIPRIVFERVPIGRQHRAETAGVCNDDSISRKGIKILLRQSPRAIKIARVCVQRSTANLRRRR